MKKIIGLLMALALTSCSYYENKVEVHSCMGNTGLDSSLFAGVAEANVTAAVTYRVRVDLLGEELSREVESSNIISDCRVSRCNPGYIAHDAPASLSILQKLCLPTPPICQEISFLNLEGTSIPKISFAETNVPLSEVVAYQNKETEECLGEFSCTEGFSVNSSNPEDLSCVASSAACEGEELSPGAMAGVKYWDSEINEYGQCNITQCNEGFILGENMCGPMGPPPPPMMFGCTDPRAVNYNPIATMNDMSCMCTFPTVYSPVMGCEGMPE